MRLLVYDDGRFLGTVGGGCVEADVVEVALDVLRTGRPRRVTFRLTERATGRAGLACGGELEVFVEAVGVPALFVFGAGHIARDLVPIARRAGFRVTVIDDRESFASPEHFPEAAEVIAAPSFEAAFERANVLPDSACVIVTRGHAFDLECTAFALTSPAHYVGLIGSQTKVRTLVRRLATEPALANVDWSRLHAPVGLALGGGSHGEIALAIAAELVAHRHETSGHAHMRIHPDEVRSIVDRARAEAAQAHAADRATP